MCTFNLRKVTIEDAKTLFDWSNDPVTRQNSFQSKPITWDEHISWLRKKLNDENCFFYILTDGVNDCGTIRLDCIDRKDVENATIDSENDSENNSTSNVTSNSTSESRYGLISFSIAPEQRGKGLGTKLLLLLEQKLIELQENNVEVTVPKVNLLRGEVKKENVASRRCFEANGYEMENEMSGELIFSKKI